MNMFKIVLNIFNSALNLLRYSKFAYEINLEQICRLNVKIIDILLFYQGCTASFWL